MATLTSASVVYGVLLIAGGAMGYAKSGSTASLVAGAGSGVAVLLLEWALGAFPRYRAPISVGQCLIAGALFWLMGNRFVASHKVMPAGLVAGLSGGLLVGYAARLNGKVHTAW